MPHSPVLRYLTAPEISISEKAADQIRFFQR